MGTEEKKPRYNVPRSWTTSAEARSAIRARDLATLGFSFDEYQELINTNLKANLLAELPARATILYYGFNAEKPHTVMEVAHKLNRPASRVRDALNEALQFAYQNKKVER